MEIRDAIHHTFIGFMLILISRIMKCINTSALGDYAGESGFNLSTIINVISNMMACISVVVVIGGIVRLVLCIKGGDIVGDSTKLERGIHMSIPIIRQRKFGGFSVKNEIIDIPSSFTDEQIKEITKVVETPLNVIFNKINLSSYEYMQKKLYGIYAGFEPYIQTICEDVTSFVDKYDNAMSQEEKEILWDSFISSSYVIQDAIGTISEKIHDAIQDEVIYRADYENALRSLSKSEATQNATGYQLFGNLKMLNTLYSDEIDNLQTKYDKKSKKKNKNA
mgnify:FL=1